MYRRYTYRIHTTKALEARFQEVLNVCRELYNAGLQERIGAYECTGRQISFFDQVGQLTAIKQDRPELNDINAQVLYDALNRVDGNFKRFWGRLKARVKGARIPRYKSASRYHSFTYPQYGHGCKILDTGRLRLHSVGVVKVRWHRPLVGKIKTCTISRKGMKWYASFVVEQEPQPLPSTGKTVGIDVGIEFFATLSDETQIENPRFLTQAHKQLRKARRKMGRRVKGSNRRTKAIKRVQDLYRHVFNQRHDFQHKLSTNLIRQYDVIAIEKLSLNMMAKGHISSSFHDVAWGAFFDKLRYKAESAGKQVIEVDARGTSQTCTCGTTVKKPWGLRWHECSICGLSQHRDIVSAKVILQRAVGLTVQDIKYQVTDCLS